MTWGQKGTTWGRRGAGVLIIACDTGRILLGMRSEFVSEPGTWGVPGGKVDPGEKPIQSARREVREELGLAIGRLRLLGTVTRPGFRYETYCTVVPVERDVQVTLNWETERVKWFSVDRLPRGLHPGLRETLSNEDVKAIVRSCRAA